MDNVMCLNPWDPQSKRQYMIDGVYATLNAGHAIGGQAHGICYETHINNESHFYETASIFEENWVERNTVNALRNHATGVGMGAVVQQIGGQAHGICYCFQQNQREEVRNMGEQAGALTAEPGMHNNNYLCYCIEGNVVDRVSSKNGKGWCEDVSPTLNTQDRHAICFQLCGDRDNPSVSLSDKAYCIPANPMSDRGQAVCYMK